MQQRISIQTEAFDMAAEQQQLLQDNASIGALVSFCGLMRDINEGDDVLAMELEHYPGMTEQALQKIIDQAEDRWDILACRIIHRVGKLLPLDPIVLVAVVSQHRGDAFNACEFIMDYLKNDAPFWKKETLRDGSSRWVASKHSDAKAQQRW